MGRKKNNDRLGAGARRGVTVTVTTTPQTLDELLNAKVAGRALMPNLRNINLHNNSGSEVVFILENESQTVTEGVRIATNSQRSYETSETAWGETGSIEGDSISGSYFATAANTAALIVEELA